MNAPYSTGIAPYQEKAPSKTPQAVLSTITKTANVVGKLAEGKMKKESIYNSATKYAEGLPEDIKKQYTDGLPNPSKYSVEEYPEALNNHLVKTLQLLSSKYGDQAAMDWATSKAGVSASDTAGLVKGAKEEKTAEGVSQYETIIGRGKPTGVPG